MSKQKSILNYFSRSPQIRKDSVLMTANCENQNKTEATPNSKKNKLSSPQHKNDLTPKRLKNADDKFSSKKFDSSSKKRVATPTAEEKDKNKRIRKKSPSTSSPENNPSEINPSGLKKPNKDKYKRIQFKSDSEDQDSSVEEIQDDDEYKPEDILGSSDSESCDDISDSSIETPDEEESDIAESPVKKSTKEKNIKVKGLSDTTIAKLSAFCPDRSICSPTSNQISKEWPHLNFDFLQPDKIRDKNGRKPDHPDYDEKTLYIPENFLRKQTPAMQQWWSFKSDHYDTILFFKMGKFYEAFHMDAVICVRELNLLYMRGDNAHAGFPERSYKRFSDTMLTKGYKIARIEQTETPEQRDERSKKEKKVSKVVSREICRITTIGTRTCSVLDAEPSTSQSLFLLAFVEREQDAASCELGVCFIDTSIGKFHMGQFTDDRLCSNLRTLISHHPPSQIILEKGKVSNLVKKTLEQCLPSVMKTWLKPVKEFWTSQKTLSLLNSDYFKNDLPEFLNNILDPDDLLKEKPIKGWDLAVRALGGIIFQLKECLIEEEIITMRLFEKYEPGAEKLLGRNMVLDSVTLKNLEIFENTNRGIEGTLIEVIDHCSTRFGKRLLRSWLCLPLCNLEEIEKRLDAVEDLSRGDIYREIEDIMKMLSKLPDLERLLSKIHTQGCARRSETHPDSRAVLFDVNIYSKRKIDDFLSAIEGFKNAFEIREQVHEITNSDLIKSLSSFKPEGLFPDIKDLIISFDKSFDHAEAKKIGRIIPRKNVDPDYDKAIQKITEIERALEQYRAEQSKYFGCKVTYVSLGKNRYQLEVPVSCANRAGDDYHFSGQRKGFKRFYTNESKRLVSNLNAAEEEKEKILQSSMRKLFESFDKYYNEWVEIVKCIGVIDCIISFVRCVRFMRSSGEVCRPKFTSGDELIIDIKEARHPSLLKYIPNFTPNDIKLKGEVMLLTGPNMGGKSTLMRSTGVIALMAQIGCLVPASKCLLTVIDRIFTRLGAYDRILEGESTFYVELSETSVILRDASKWSLVLLDELGRGTSTDDGTAIAGSVVKELSIRGCRTFFSTHYHNLVEEFSNEPNIVLSHMACMVEKESEDPSEECITFLYKLSPGACPQSYAFNAARLAGIPISIIKSAHERAKKFEEEKKIEQAIFKLVKSDLNVSQIQELRKILKECTVEFCKK